MKVRSRLTIRENYAFLLAGLLVLLLLIPSAGSIIRLSPDFWLMKISVHLGFSLMMLIGVWSLSREGRIFRVGLGLAALATGLVTAEFFVDSPLLELGSGMLVLIFSLISGYIAARHVFSAERVDRNILFGAVCVYLLIGLVWAVLYGMIMEILPSSFQGLSLHGNRVPFDDLLYYSFVTLASLGYGDITPLAPLARTLAYLEAVAGQFYLAIMVAGLVGLFMRDRGSS